MNKAMSTPQKNIKVKSDYVPQLSIVRDQISHRIVRTCDIDSTSHRYLVLEDNNIGNKLVLIEDYPEIQMLVSILMRDWIQVCDIFVKEYPKGFRYFSRIHNLSYFPTQYTQEEICTHMLFMQLVLGGSNIEHCINDDHNITIDRGQYYLYDFAESDIFTEIEDGDTGELSTINEIMGYTIDNIYESVFLDDKKPKFSKQALQDKILKFLKYWMSDVDISHQRFLEHCKTSKIPEDEIPYMWSQFYESLSGLEKRVNKFTADFEEFSI